MKTMKFNVTKLAPSERGKRKRETDSNIYFLSGINVFNNKRAKEAKDKGAGEARSAIDFTIRSVSCRFSHGFSRNRVSQLRCSYFPPLDKGGGRERERESSKIVVNLSWILLPLSRGLRFFAWLTLQGCPPPPQRVFPELIRPENSTFQFPYPKK